MDNQILDGEIPKQELVNLKIYRDLHQRICKMVKGDRKNFRIQSDVVRFIFEQYDEKIQDKNHSMQNRLGMVSRDSTEEILKKLDSVLEQNKTIAKGIMLMEEKIIKIKEVQTNGEDKNLSRKL